MDPQPDGPPDVAGQPEDQVHVYFDRYPKFKGHEAIAGAITESGTRRPAGANRQHALYYTARPSGPSTLTSRLLLEGGLLDQRRVPTPAAISRASRRRAERRSGIPDRQEKSSWLRHGDAVPLLERPAALPPTAPTRGNTCTRRSLRTSPARHAVKSGVQWALRRLRDSRRSSTAIWFSSIATACPTGARLQHAASARTNS